MGRDAAAPPARAGGGVLGGAALGLVLAAVVSGCFVRQWVGQRKLTGTCDGACSYYLDCKDADGAPARAACVTDCEQVFGDPESLRAFESLSCRDAIEYVEGDATAAR